ncbi:MAG: hypothetical protein IJU52_06535 [Clostridia bacterium]|nr:hypothetical protein [Clostridia bacterium]
MHEFSFLRLRSTASQTNWLIIREFTAKKRYALPEGFTMDGQADFDLSPALDLSLFTSFSHSGKGLAGKTLKIDVSGSASAELYLTRLSGISVFTENADKERAAVLLAPCAVIDLTNAVTLCIEFTGEKVGIAEIVIRQAPRN